MQDRFEIVEYNPDWRLCFLAEQEIIKNYPFEAVAIEHVGSTAIPGQWAKPIIDIFIAVPVVKAVSYYESFLLKPDYSFVATGMPGRLLFAKHTNGIWTHNLHILPYSESFYSRNEFLFLDYLKSHHDLIIRYGKLKEELIGNQDLSIEGYTRLKTDFIQEVVDLARQERGLPWENVWEE
ncbi:GrpB family protein [Mucilaginibacter sabulilitoris]|uniref:GrpB family protein n=1 Tax=Mucilaginibacter sabulilitoris TaxID=1173583 RepID=A0ABZ0TK92_9SPHI|nr:GrpB family protein [Mucilaginibacter sabulilitoris]WPU93585.1 GrpB family protein [Mucilaginibacter sabulilitoris]